MSESIAAIIDEMVSAIIAAAAAPLAGGSGGEAQLSTPQVQRSAAIPDFRIFNKIMTAMLNFAGFVSPR
jgi:hypothetical protein